MTRRVYGLAKPRRLPVTGAFAALSLALALVNLLVLPFGTAFGVYALWVLLRDAGRRMFEPAR